MDKSEKQEQENNKDRKKEPHTATSTTAPQPLNNPSPNDDDSITTSTESSETFETWTLVMDKQKNDEDRVEIVRNTEGEDDEEEEEDHEMEENADLTDHKELQDSLQDVATDDLSDGISIISETESNGRISPHPYLRDHLQDLNLKFVTAQHNDNEILYNLRDDTAVHPPFPTPVLVQPEQQVRQRPGRSTSNGQQEDRDKAVQMASQTVAELSSIPPMVKRGLQGIFYIGVALAILSLIGRMRNPTWGTTSPSSAELEQKVNDMELQNNLMRAEIDLLNKQVKYLNTMNEPQQQHQKKSGKYKGQYEESFESKEGKKFKAWAGNGDSLRPVEITKGDLKRPYKCPDGSFREFAGMCVENRKNEPNIVEQFEQVVEDFKQQSETMQTFEKVAQELHGFTENPFEQVQQILTQNGNQEEPDVKMRQHLEKQTNEFLKNKPIYKTEDSQQQQQRTPPPSPKEGEEYNHQQRPSSVHDRRKDYAKSKERYDNKQAFDTKSFDKDYKKPYDKDYNKDHHKAFDNQSKERKPKHRDGPTDKDDDASKERFNKRRNDSKERFQKRDDNSKERAYKRDDDDSKERYAKRSKENSSKERFNRQNQPNESGEWQEQYMKHRADARKQNEEKYSGENKNWYMKRGDGRENKRNGDIRYR